MSPEPVEQLAYPEPLTVPKSIVQDLLDSKARSYTFSVDVDGVRLIVQVTRAELMA